jgi:AcrR family transcriptional regulator
MVAEVSVVPGTSTRRERLRAQMRQEILTASRQILRESGFKDLSMRTLAQAVGVTAPTLYDYFPSKEGVLDALFEEGCDRLQKTFRRALDSNDVGLPQLRQIAFDYRAFAHNEPDLFQLIFGRIDRQYRPAADVKAQAKGLADLLVSAIVAAIEIGDVRPVDPKAACMSVWTAVHGFVTLEINGFLDDECDPQSSEAMFEASLDMLVQGLRP